MVPSTAPHGKVTIRSGTVHGERSDQSRVDAAAQPQHDATRTAFRDVVSQAEHERLTVLLEPIDALRRSRRSGDAFGKAGERSMIETVGPEAVSVKDQLVLPPHRVHHGNRNTGTPSKHRRLLDTLSGATAPIRAR